MRTARLASRIALLAVWLIGMLPPPAAEATWSVVPSPNVLTPQGSLLKLSCSSPGACTAVGTYTDSDGYAALLVERWDGTRWTTQASRNPAGSIFTNLFAVSCTSATDCTAVGAYVMSGGGGGTLAERWDGTQWSIEDTPNRSGVSYSTLHSVSCASANLCLAVGYDSTGPLVERWNGAKWTIDSIPAPAGAQSVSLTGVSCTSASACMVVGSWINSAGQSVALAERWDGTSWTIQATASASEGDSFSDVSCSSATSCTATGSFTDSAGNRSPLAHWDGTSWTIQAAPQVAGALGSGLDGVSCDRTGVCTAVGTYIDGSGAQAPFAERWDGTSWTIQGTPVPPGAHGSRVRAVACPTASACIAAGSATAAATVTLAEHWDGTSWTIEPTPNPSGSLGSKLLGLSCTSEIACTAVGSGDQQTLAERWDGTSWQIEPTRAPDGAMSSVLQAVACPTSASCIAVGSYTKSDGYPAPLIERWDGESWSIEPDPGLQSGALQAVSCPSAEVCIAVGAGLAELWDGTTWKPAPAPTGDVQGVSCTSASACTAVGSHRDRTLALRWDGTKWTTQPTPPDGSSNHLPFASRSVLEAVSCTSPSDCVAVGSRGSTSPMSGYHPAQTLMERWDGANWTLEANPAEPAFSSLAGVSCTSDVTCIAVGSSVDGTLALGWDGLTWTIQTAPTTSGRLEAVSCVAPGSCTAVGRVANAMGTPMTLVEHSSPSPPGLISRPSIDGLARQGQTLREVHGSWSNRPTSFSYQWKRCGSGGVDCGLISGATSQTYTLTSADVGQTIVVSEVARNADGAGNPADSAPTTVVQRAVTPPVKPTNAALPKDSGTTRVWYEVSASPGRWSGTRPISYAYRWQRCTPRCGSIAKATRRSYVLTPADRHARIRVLVRATNRAGSTSAGSRQTRTVAPAASRAQDKARLLRELAPHGKAARIAAPLKAGAYRLSMKALTAGRTEIDWYHRKGTGKARPKPVLVAAGRARFAKAGPVTVRIKLTARGEQLLEHAKRLKLTAKGTYAPRGQKRVVATKPFTLRR